MIIDHSHPGFPEFKFSETSISEGSHPSINPEPDEPEFPDLMHQVPPVDHNYPLKAQGVPMRPLESTLPGFNPSGSEVVSTIKLLTEDLFTYIRNHVPDNRERSIALTEFEQGAMWAVKANFTK